jgi:hypothetical protein
MQPPGTLQMQPPGGAPAMQPPGTLQMQPPGGAPAMQPPGTLQMQPPVDDGPLDIYGFDEDTDISFFSTDGASDDEPLEVVGCYNCGGHIKVFTEERPITLACPDCGLESMLED